MPVDINSFLFYFVSSLQVDSRFSDIGLFGHFDIWVLCFTIVHKSIYVEKYTKKTKKYFWF